MQQPTDHKQMFFKPGLSVTTSINPYIDESPFHFWQKSSYNPKRVREPATEAMIFGRLTHVLLLTPEQFDKDFIVEPDKKEIKGALVVDTVEELKAELKKFKEANPEAKVPVSGSRTDLIKLVRENCKGVVIWEDHMQMWRQSAGRRDIISRETYERAKNMVDCCLAHPSVKRLIGNGHAEEPYTWYREEGGLLCKAKIDYTRSGLWIDYKTGMDVGNGHIDSDSSPDARDVPFSKVMAQRGYHRQAAWGLDGIEAITGERPRGAVMIAQDKTFPEAISFNVITTNALNIGARENAWAYEKIKQRLAMWAQLPEAEKINAWPAYHHDLRGVDLPRWYKSPAMA